MSFYKNWRRDLKVSQQELSMRSGVPLYRIQMVERGWSTFSSKEHEGVSDYLERIQDERILKLGEFSEKNKGGRHV